MCNCNQQTATQQQAISECTDNVETYPADPDYPVSDSLVIETQTTAQQTLPNPAYPISDSLVVETQISETVANTAYPVSDSLVIETQAPATIPNPLYPASDSLVIETQITAPQTAPTQKPSSTALWIIPLLLILLIGRRREKK